MAVYIQILLDHIELLAVKFLIHYIPQGIQDGLVDRISC